MIRGHCLCGDIRFETSATVTEPCMCHCGQCRRQSGGIWASAQVPYDALKISGTPSWFVVSDQARRGFCQRCGSFLFWQGAGEDEISFALGALEPGAGIKIAKHIFVADKGDYYDIADGVPQSEQ